jgi:MFS family permease
MRLHLNRDIKLFLSATLLYGFSFSIWELFYNLYILSLGFNSDTLGLVRSAAPLAALILGLPLGILSDRIGRRKSMVLGLGTCFLGMFLQIQLAQPGLIFLFGLVQGAGLMLYHVSQPPFIMAASREEDQAMVFSLNFGLLTLAAMIGNLVGGQFPKLLESTFSIIEGSAFSYRWIMSTVIIFATTGLIPILLISENQAFKNNRENPLLNRKFFRDLIANTVARHLALINLITGFGAALLIPYLNVFLKSKFAINDDLLGLFFSISSLLVFLGTIISPWLVKLTRSRIIPTVSTQAFSLVFLFLLGFSPSLWIVFIALLMRTVLMQMSAPLLDNHSMVISRPGEQGLIASVRGIAWQLGQAIGIFISGLVQTRFGFSPLFITTGLLYTAAIFLTWIYFRPGEKETPYAGRA